MFKISKVSGAEVKARALLVIPTYVGREEDYRYHLELVLEKFFKDKSSL